jgi:purine-binding chemotaxis protein CheW
MSEQATAYVTLRVGAESYAVEAGTIAELVVLQPLTHLPTMPPSVRGLMNLRGTVVPIVDLARQLGLGDTAIGPRTCAVISAVEADGVRSLIGVIADELQDVVMLGASEVEPPPAFGSRIKTDYLVGIARPSAGRYMLVLDLTRIVSPDEIIAAVSA